MSLSYFWLVYTDMINNREKKMIEESEYVDMINKEEKKMIEGGYVSCSLYLENVSGKKIVEEHTRINLSEHMKVMATTILHGNTGNFHAWIYYKVKAEKLNSLQVEESIEKIEATPQVEREEIVTRAFEGVKLETTPKQNANIKIDIK